MNGMIIIGFNTIGKPKMIGSLIPKIPGTMLNLPNTLIRSDLQNSSIQITSDSVLPPPPKFVKKFENGFVKICGNSLFGVPASNASS